MLAYSMFTVLVPHTGELMYIYSKGFYLYI